MIANTMEEEMEALRFPIGRWKKPAAMNAKPIADAVADIAKFPNELAAVLKQMDAQMLNRRYRPGGWTGRQVVHHLADSHMNALIRFKLALTEDQPTIKPYMEDRWAELADYEEDVDLPMQILKPLHNKWVKLMQSLEESDWQRDYAHPEYGEIFKLWAVVSLYQWHCAHHLGHLKLILGEYAG